MLFQDHLQIRPYKHQFDAYKMNMKIDEGKNAQSVDRVIDR